jgi:hypothetical protein
MQWATHFLGATSVAHRLVQEVCSPMRKLYNLLHHEEAQTMTEYATVLTVITIFCLAAFTLLAAASTGSIARVAGYFS